MQWILDNLTLVMVVIGCALLSGVAVGWWVKQKMTLGHQLLKQQMESARELSNEQIGQLQKALEQANQELDQLDAERDKAAYELKQVHGQHMASLEKAYLENSNRSVSITPSA